MFGRRVILLAAALVVALFVQSPARADEAVAQGAEKFILELADRALTQLTDKAVPVAEQEQRFRSIIKDNIAFESIARWVLGGRFWGIASEAQRARYLGLFEDLMVATYAHRFQDYAGEAFAVSSTRVIDEKQALVQSTVTRANADKPLRIDWRVRETDGQFRIIDIMIEGLSLAQAQRAEFASVLKDNGGNIDSLLGELEKRLNSARAGSATPAVSGATLKS